MIDLHMHSTGSDGQYAPAELMKKAKAGGLTAVALTDHDSSSGLIEAGEIAAALGLEFFPGIEISCKYAGEMHMLGYGIRPMSEAIQKACAKFVELRELRARKIIAYLASKGVGISLADVRRKAGGQILGRPHFAQVMLEQGYVRTIREAFDRYLATPEFDKIERPKPAPEAGIKIIHDGGGVAVLAHPKSLKLAGDALERQVRTLVDAGLDGIETYYGAHTPEQIAEYHALALKYHLLETAGSDFHGEKVKPEISLGRRQGSADLLVSEEQEAEILLELRKHVPAK